jgi:hypothetical protein
MFNVKHLCRLFAVKDFGLARGFSGEAVHPNWVKDFRVDGAGAESAAFGSGG